MTVDLIIFAIIAAVVAYRMYQTLGVLDEGEKEKQQEKAQTIIKVKSAKKVEEKPAEELQEDNSELLELDKKYLNLLSASQAGNYHKIREKSSDFYLHKFIKNAEKAFELIITAFVNNDKQSLKKLTSAAISEKFSQEAEQIKSNKQKLDINLISVETQKIKDIKITADQAELTLVFLSEQISQVTDSSGQLVSGDAKKIQEISDIWTFSKDLSKKDPIWLLTKISNE